MAGTEVAGSSAWNPQVTRRKLDVEAGGSRRQGGSESRRADRRASRKKEQLEAK